MYFPYLRGKREELLAIEELADFIKIRNNVIPIIEPANLNRTTQNFLEFIAKNGIKILLIVNSKIFSLINEHQNILKEIEGTSIIPALIIDNYNCNIEEDRILGNSNACICFNETSQNLNLLEKYNNGLCILLENSFSKLAINEIISKNNVVGLNDHYKPASRNADFLEKEFFSDDYIEYKSKKYFGFSDFQTVGHVISNGGPAYAVALHLTYQMNNSIWINHFISDDTETTANVQGKYLQALTKLVSFLKNSNTLKVSTHKKYENNLITREYHGLGYPKRLSIENHIELLSMLI